MPVVSGSRHVRQIVPEADALRDGRQEDLPDPTNTNRLRINENYLYIKQINAFKERTPAGLDRNGAAKSGLDREASIASRTPGQCVYRSLTRRRQVAVRVIRA